MGLMVCLSGCRWPSTRTDGASDGARERALAAMESVMGRLPGSERRCPLDVRTVSETDAGGYVRLELSYQSEPGDRVPAYLLIPKSALASHRRRYPAVLALHQTHPAAGGEMAADRLLPPPG